MVVLENCQITVLVVIQLLCVYYVLMAGSRQVAMWIYTSRRT